ncbi:MAG: response regulator, partial [Halothece sp. Uz-M2-17]|nr:response regulator [Halothece sp. Uz-M2-17]
FLDLIMPNTNGYEICTQLRRVSSLQEIPIIILTGKDGLIDRMRAKMVGATQYMSKPVDRSTILESVQKYLPYHRSQPISTNPHSSSASAEN